MAIDGTKKNNRPIRVSASCLAEFVTAYGRSVESILRPYKFKRGEGLARSNYYKSALVTIRLYHASSNDLVVFEEALQELRVRADQSANPRDRSKLQHNVTAIEAYRRIYKDRQFKVLPNHRISYRLGQIEITAQPDLWVEENGTPVLVKLGVSKKNRSYVDILLTVMRKAAVSGKYKVRPRNIVYLDITSRRELICRPGLSRFNSTLRAGARDIAAAWPNMQEPPKSDASDRGPK